MPQNSMAEGHEMNPLTEYEITLIERELDQLETTNFVDNRWSRAAQFIDTAPYQMRRLIATVEHLRGELTEANNQIQEMQEQES